MDSVVSQLDRVIMGLLEEREALYALGPGEARPQGRQGAARIFSEPFLQAGSIRAQAYHPFLEGYAVGFEAEREPVIYLGQESKLDTFLSPPDHHFVFALSVAEPNHTGWITLEREVGTFNAESALSVNLAMKMSAEMAADMRLELHVPVDGGDKVLVNLKKFSLQGGGQYETVTVSSTVDFREHGLPESVKEVEPKLVLFFPPDKVGTYRLAYQTFLASA